MVPFWQASTSAHFSFPSLTSSLPCRCSVQLRTSYADPCMHKWRPRSRCLEPCDWDGRLVRNVDLAQLAAEYVWAPTVSDGEKGKLGDDTKDEKGGTKGKDSREKKKADGGARCWRRFASQK